MQPIPEFRNKIGRNTLCPCGSMKKFKNCHGHHTSPPDPNIYKIAATVRETTRKSACHVPEGIRNECSKGIINAHTVSRSGSLGAIQRSGHVYSYNLNMLALQKSRGRLRPVETGWRTASTFPGFCGYHDKRVFEALEDTPFVGSKEQCFLIAYRSLAKEIHAKNNSAKQNDLRVAYAGPASQKNAAVAAFNKGVALAIRDLERHKNRYDKVLLDKDWSKVHGILIEFDGIFPIQCTGGLFPEKDINGLPIQRLDWRTATPDTINLSSFAADGKSYFLICWLQDSHHSGSRFVAPFHLVEKSVLPAVIGALILQVTENCHFSPDWYDALPDAGKDWCEANSFSGTFWGDISPPTAIADTTLFPGINVTSITAF
ncbi:SEC-C metal-binding domain-containing protein [Pseudoduganella sp. GCM10020061]|uniref:SEC-C metal-binding domain-containing protein n=1 Tax=Pseudoduganella sp. GCM10020061 TaxID=3317345 RepID=UPI003629836F